MENKIEGQGLMWDHEGIRPIQGVFEVNAPIIRAEDTTYSIKPDMLRHTREAEDVPEEVREAYIEAVGAELIQAQYDVNAPIVAKKTNHAYDHIIDTASFLNKEGLE